jgi:hypothetical protein
VVFHTPADQRAFLNTPADARAFLRAPADQRAFLRAPADQRAFCVCFPYLGGFMNPVKLIGLVLVIAGVLAVAFGGFSYTKDSQALKVGPLELSVKQKETVNVPLWAGLGAVVAGGLLLVLGKR